MKLIIFMVGLFCALGLSFNAVADDVIDYYLDSGWELTDNLIITDEGEIDTWDDGIEAEFSSYWIQNYGIVNSQGNIGILADEMSGDITNYIDGYIYGRDEAIGAWKMYGNIYNYGTIESYDGEDSVGIYAQLMAGNIYNYSGGNVEGEYYGILAIGATGSIINYSNGYIYGDNIGIYAYIMRGDINNSGKIGGDDAGINSTYMFGSIYNFADAEIEGEEYGIYAEDMIGSIYNSGDIYGDDEAGIYARYMSGNIYNYEDGYIANYDGYGIDARYMSGNIYNNGYISSYYGRAIYASSMSGNIYNDDVITSSWDNAIYARYMSGNIYNNGYISSYYEYAINASYMEGDIYNYEGGVMISQDDAALDLYKFEGTLYNYGTIEGGDGISISGSHTLNIVGNGTFIGDIYNDTEAYATLNLSNDIDNTVLDLSDATLVYWDEINLLQGEMIITDIYHYTYLEITQTGDDTYVHFGAYFYGNSYNLEAGTLNPYSSKSAFRYLEFERFYANAGSTIEIDFGFEGESDLIWAVGDGYIETDVIIKLVPNEIFEKGFEDTYNIFGWIEVDDIIIEIPLLYTAAGFDDEAFYEVTISRKDESYTDYANTYNKGFANLIDGLDNEDAESLQLALEQSFSVDEFNAVLEPFNMVGYASLANNNVNYINTRTNKLFNILSNDSGAETTAANTPIGSGYATANPGVGRDANGNDVWFNVYMSDSTLDGKAGYELESDGYEVAFGIDRAINANTIAGLAFHYSDYSSDVNGGLPVTVDTEGFGFNLYGQYSQGTLTHKAIIGFTEYDNDADHVGAEADFDSNEFYIAYRVEDLFKKDKFDIVPFAGLTYSHITYDDIVEDGGVNGLEGYDYDSLQAELGVKLVKQFNKLKADLGISWIHELMDTESEATATSDLGNYDQDGIERDEDIFRVSLGVDYRLNEKINLSLEYAKEFGDNTNSDSVEARVSISF